LTNESLGEYSLNGRGGLFEEITNENKSGNDMAKKSVKIRLFFGSILIIVLGALFLIDIHYYRLVHMSDSTFWAKLLGDGLIVAVLGSLMAMVGGYEAMALAKSKGARPHGWIVILGVLLLTFQPLLIINSGSWKPIFEAGSLLGLLLVLAVCSQFIRKTTQNAGSDLAWSVFILAYIGLLLSFTVAVRRDFGPGAIIIMLAATKGSDIGAYFTGMTFGKHKLIPWLSPGKTIEGFIGAMVFSSIITISLWKIPYIINVSLLPKNFGFVILILLGIGFAVIGHLGDLAESLLKRDANAKDSAHLLPEFGGVLDMIDSVLPVGLWWYLVLKISQEF
jgi:phosphatidate cytidylyltransferase